MSSDRAYYLLGLRIAADFGATIAIPVVAFAWLGNTLDGKWGTKPLMLIAGFAVAALITTVSIRRKAKAYAKEYEFLINKKQP